MFTETPWVRRLLLWGPAWSCAGLIFALSHQSFAPGTVPVPDYLGHLAAYFCLCGALVWGYSEMFSRALSSRQAVLAWLWSSAYGVTDEIHQSFIPLRDPSVGDVLVDAGAALLAAVVGWAFLRWRHRV